MPATISTFLPGLITSGVPEIFSPPFAEVVNVKPDLLIAFATSCAVATLFSTFAILFSASATACSAALRTASGAVVGKLFNASFASFNAFCISGVTGP